MSSKFDKVLLIGIDGMDPRVIKELAKKNKIPNFKKLLDNNSFSELETSNPPQSPVAWTSIATGVNPGKHNIFDFIRINKDNYLPELSLTKSSQGILKTNYDSFIDSESFWKTLSNNGIPVCVIRWPLSFPAKEINGKLLSGLGVPDIKGLLNSYTFYTSKSKVNNSKKVKLVQVNDKIIKTEIIGPRVKTKNGFKNLSVPLNISIKDKHALLNINYNNKNNRNNIKVLHDTWSEWINIEFKIGLFKKINGIFKVYISSLNPFEMFMTSIQTNPLKSSLDISYPKSYSSNLAKKFGLFYTLGMPEETDAFMDGKLSKKAFLKQVDDIEKEREQLFWYEFDNFKQEDKSLFSFVFDSSDRLQHLFWEEKNILKKEFKINKVIEDYYIKKDLFIAKVLTKLPKKTLLIILSDHGFTSFEKSVNINTWLVNEGFMNLYDGDFKTGEKGALFQDVNWSNTSAYSVGFNSLYLNIKNRESKGIIVNKTNLIKELIFRLEELKDEETGKSVIHKIYKSEDIYNGKNLANAPDLIIGFKPGYRMSWENAIGGFSKQTIELNKKKWKGDHLIDYSFVPGVLFSNIKLKKKSYSQKDIAATITNALNINHEYEGKSILK